MNPKMVNRLCWQVPLDCGLQSPGGEGCSTEALGPWTVQLSATQNHVASTSLNLSRLQRRDS